MVPAVFEKSATINNWDFVLFTLNKDQNTQGQVKGIYLLLEVPNQSEMKYDFYLGGMSIYDESYLSRAKQISLTDINS